MIVTEYNIELHILWYIGYKKRVTKNVINTNIIKNHDIKYYQLAGPASSKMKMSHLILITELETIIMSLNYIPNEYNTIILSNSL